MERVVSPRRLGNVGRTASSSALASASRSVVKGMNKEGLNKALSFAALLEESYSRTFSDSLGAGSFTVSSS